MISLIHPSRNRAIKARTTLDYWYSMASGETEIEHILSLDSDDGQLAHYKQTFTKSEILVNPNTCVVEATNIAAKESKGDILIYLSDDFKCPKNWDLLITERMEMENPSLLKVDDCLQKFSAEVLTIPIMNRVLYNYLKYFWHPGYKSQWVDVDLYHVCANSNWINFAPELRFPHEHYCNGKAIKDETYLRSDANWNQGREVFARRKAEGFKL